jgi:flagellar basal-body rod protein FlgB
LLCWSGLAFGIGAAWYRSMLENMFQSASYQATKAFLDVAAERHKVLAGNLANAETPGYRRLELSPSFERTLKASVASGDLQSFDASGMSFVEDQNPTFRSDSTGNNVSEDQELMILNENALRYEALGQFASGSLRQLKTAITGRSS